MHVEAMRLCSAAASIFFPRPVLGGLPWILRRGLMTLAIETSCDDTSVAVLERGELNGRQIARLHFHGNVTSKHGEFGGIHPLVSLQSHQEHLAKLVEEAIEHLPVSERAKGLDGEVDQKAEATMEKRLPHVITVSRGPGMRSNLSTGLELAKGLALAWRKPLVGVHHMQAHALTPRLVSALEAYPAHTSCPHSSLDDGAGSMSPEFPFLSLLVSGGHTLLIHSKSLTEHRVMGTTGDIAIGDCLDKIARVVLPPEVLQASQSTMYASLLEDFAFGHMWQKEEQAQREAQGWEGKKTADEEPSPRLSTRFSFQAQPVSVKGYLKDHAHRYPWYQVPANQEDARHKSTTKWAWAFHQPLAKAGGGTKMNSLEMSFSGLLTGVERAARYGMDPATGKLNNTLRTAADFGIDERRDMAREAMRAAFEHVASRLLLGLQSLAHLSTTQPPIVLAGGVAANSFLRHILVSTLHARGYDNVHLHFPPPAFCTDNAPMIGWAGLEMFRAGYTDALSIRAIRKWPLDQLLTPPNDQ